MNTSYNKTRKILWIGIISLIMFTVAIILSIIVAINMGKNKEWIDVNSWKEIPDGQFPYIIGIIIITIDYVILSFVSAIMILSTDFKNREVNNSRRLWGTLCLLLLSSVGAVFFGVIASRRLRSAKTIQE